MNPRYQRPECECCGEPIAAKRWGAKTCSNKCRQALYRRRVALASAAKKEKARRANKKRAATRRRNAKAK